jgi:peptide/nickel transport system ATP-binding protein
MRGLMGATPSATPARGGRLVDIPGAVPALGALPAGCAFMNRCPDVFDRCRAARPELTTPVEGRQVACFAQQRENHGHVAPVGA